MDDLETEFTEALLPEKSIAELLPDIAQVGASLSRIIPDLEEWEDWFEDDEAQRGDVIQQAGAMLVEAQTAIHAAAAMLHLSLTGMAPPSDLFEDDESDDE